MDAIDDRLPLKASHLRIASPARDLARTGRFWVSGLGLRVLERVQPLAAGEHELVILGWPGAAWHLKLPATDGQSPPAPAEEDLLVLPGGHGINGPAFDVVIPSLPGYGFSSRPDVPGGVTFRYVAGLWRQLMRGLGYSRHGAGGVDFGAGVATFMALDDPGPLTGLHLTNLELTPYTGPGSKQLSAAEQAYLYQAKQWGQAERGYTAIHSSSMRDYHDNRRWQGESRLGARDRARVPTAVAVLLIPKASRPGNGPSACMTSATDRNAPRRALRPRRRTRTHHPRHRNLLRHPGPMTSARSRAQNVPVMRILTTNHPACDGRPDQFLSRDDRSRRSSRSATGVPERKHLTAGPARASMALDAPVHDAQDVRFWPESDDGDGGISRVYSLV